MRQTPRFVFLLALATLAVLVVWHDVLLSSHPSLVELSSTLHRPFARPPSSPRPRPKPKLHFLLPATNAPVLFCKTLASALVHDVRPLAFSLNSAGLS